MSHVHTYAVDHSMSADEAWKELCIFGRRITWSGKGTSWASRKCDGIECLFIQDESDGR